jgi:hypothetical protein
MEEAVYNEEAKDADCDNFKKLEYPNSKYEVEVM